MPTPLTPSSSQEIVPISPPKNLKRKAHDTKATTLPLPAPVKLDRALEERVAKRIKDQERVERSQTGVSKAKKEDAERQRSEAAGMSRGRVTERMMGSLGKSINPITNSDMYSRTDHFISAAMGHQQSNRGGGSAGAATYWEVRNAKMAEQAREQRTSILAGCIIYINGSTGPKLSNLQLQQMITSNGGRFTATQNGSCTHIVANGGLSGSKTQKWIDGQAGRGGSKRLKVVNVDWVIDSVAKGQKLSEMRYSMIGNPSQQNLFSAFGVKPSGKSDSSSK